MSWVVVRFVNEDNVEVVPTKWICKDEKNCFWPPPTVEKIDNLIKNCVEPEVAWSKYEIKMMCRKPYEKFGLATSQATKACSVSDIDSSEVELPQKRVRKPKVIDDSSSSEEDDIYEIPNPPSLNSANPRANTSKLDHNIILSQEATCEESSSTKVMSYDENFKSEVIKFLVTITNTIRNQNQAIEEIKRKVDFLSEKFEDVTGEAKAKDDILIKILEMLPLKNGDDLLKLENLLTNESTFLNMVQTLSKLGGANYKDCVRRIMGRCLQNELAVEYSYRGHKAKKDFSKTKLCTVIIASVSKFEKNNVTEKDIELTMAIWLSKAGERLKEKVSKEKE